METERSNGGNFPVRGEKEDCSIEWLSGEWIRPVGYMEKFFTYYGYFNSLNTVQAMWVTSEEPITRSIMNTALQRLVRRLPILRMCIQRRWTRLWFKQMSEPNIDFEVVDGEAKEVLENILAQSYQIKEGPLWRARMAHSITKSGISGHNDKNQTMIAFGVHHAITDSSTNMVICRELIVILNELFLNKSFVSCPYPLSPPYAENMTELSIMHLIKYSISWFFDVIVLDYNRKTSFGGILPINRNYKKAKTSTLTHVFSEEISQKFISMCKRNKTTVHSAIITAANLAYFNIAKKKARKNLEDITVYYFDTIDLRRYYNKLEREDIGCHTTAHEQKMEVNSETKFNFWNTARASKEKLHRDLDTKECLRNIPVMSGNSFILAFNMFLNKIRAVNITDRHYSTSNMGDITNAMGIAKEDDVVKLIDVFRSVNLEHCGIIFCLTFHTFRRRMNITLFYAVNKMEDELANGLFEGWKSIIEDVALVN